MTIERGFNLYEPPSKSPRSHLVRPLPPTVLNDLDRFHLAGDVVDRVPRLQRLGAHFKQFLRYKLIEHNQYIARYGDDMPEIRGWKWPYLRRWGPAQTARCAVVAAIGVARVGKLNVFSRPLPDRECRLFRGICG